MYHSFIKVDQDHHVPEFTYIGVIQQSVHETKIHDIDNLQKRSMQTCFGFDRSIVSADVTI